MITTNDLEELILYLKEIDKDFPCKYYLKPMYDKWQNLLDEVNKQPTVAVQIAIIKSSKITDYEFNQLPQTRKAER
jgi:hypothetical protein